MEVSQEYVFICETYMILSYDVRTGVMNNSLTFLIQIGKRKDGGSVSTLFVHIQYVSLVKQHIG